MGGSFLTDKRKFLFGVGIHFLCKTINTIYIDSEFILVINGFEYFL